MTEQQAEAAPAEKSSPLAKQVAAADAATRRSKQYRRQPAAPKPPREYPYMQITGERYRGDLVTVMVEPEAPDALTGQSKGMFMLQFTAAEDLKPARALEVVPGVPQLVRYKRAAG